MENHDRVFPRTEKGIRQALRLLGEERLRLLLEVKRADNLAQAPEFHDRQQELDKGETILDRLLAEEACFSLRQLAVNGKDLTDLGLSGPVVGQVLKKLLDIVMDGDLPNEREALLSSVSRFVTES